MPTLDVAGASDRMLAYKTDTGADCLVVAADAIKGSLPSLRGHSTPSAWAEWEATTGKHPASETAPEGMPGYWAGAGGFGDVCISRGDGTWAAIDTLNGVYHKGTISIQTTAQRTRQIGGAYQGWSSEFLGYQLGRSASIAANARRAVNLSNVHSAPHTAAPVVSKLQPGDVEVYDGWVVGDMVTQGGVTSQVWLVKGAHYVWLGCFDDVSTHDLPQLTEPAAPVVVPPVTTPPVVTPPAPTPTEPSLPSTSDPSSPPSDTTPSEPPTSPPGETSPAAGKPTTSAPWWVSLFQSIWAALFPKKN